MLTTETSSVVESFSVIINSQFCVFVITLCWYILFYENVYYSIP